MQITHEKRGAFRMSYSPYLDRARLRGRVAIAQMAFDFRTFAASAGSVSETDLELLGWSHSQIALLASDARHHANRDAEG